jgi:hypothetical protein
MPTRLSGRAGRGIHHGQKRMLQQQAEYIAADHFVSFELFACNRAADHTLPNGCAVATHSLGDWTNLWKGTHTCFGAGVRTSKRRVADSGKESVRPKGVGVLSAAR